MPQKVRNNIFLLRLEAGLTQEQLAHRVGVTKCLISKLELGHRKSHRTVRAISALFNTDTKWLTSPIQYRGRRRIAV